MKHKLICLQFSNRACTSKAIRLGIKTSVSFSDQLFTSNVQHRMNTHRNLGVCASSDLNVKANIAQALCTKRALVLVERRQWYNRKSHNSVVFRR